MKIKNIILLTAFLFVNSYLEPKKKREILSNVPNNVLTVKEDHDCSSKMNDFLSEIKTKFNQGKDFLLKNKVEVGAGFLVATDIVIAIIRKKIESRHIYNYLGLITLVPIILERSIDNNVKSKK